MNFLISLYTNFRKLCNFTVDVRTSDSIGPIKERIKVTQINFSSAFIMISILFATLLAHD